MQKLLGLIAFAVMAFFITPMTAISALKAEPGDTEPARAQIPLKSGWKFWRGQASAQVANWNFDDSAWENVAVPHSWNRVGYYNNNETIHSHRPDNIDKRQGIGWYRLLFTAPTLTGQKQAWLEFDAASRTAEVWLNGVRLGEHRGPFTRFRFDATDVIKPGQSNLLVVKTDNSKPTADSSTADVLPIAGDFFVHGGLYRPVRLVLTDPVHIDMQDYGGPGVYATTAALTADSAKIRVRSLLRNDGNNHTEFTLAAQLIDRDGLVVATGSETVALNPASGKESSLVLQIDSPHLWHGTKDPYLYTLRVELRSLESGLLDRLDQQYGVRQMEFDAEQGFILNGEPYRLHGVAYHQDREGKGWAVNTADTAEDVALMLELGANTIRLAHYPHGQPIHELANRHGLILWDEIPLVTLWSYGSEHALTNNGLAANAELQLKEMIRQNFNHPSVAVWGIANEVDFGAAIPAFLGRPADDTPDPMLLLETLAALVAQEDPSRPSALANCCEATGQWEDVPITAQAVDLSGVNRYYGWYYGKPDDLGLHLDELREIHSEQPLSVSEYGAGGAISLHTDNPLGGPVDSRGHDQPEEYMSLVHEQNWADIGSRPYLWASWIWNAFDFATTVRREGDAVDINTKGLITYDRKVKKDPFFFYKANWSESPTVHIAGRRYRDRAYPTIDVRVYSNAPATELVVNGHSLGKKSECRLQICIWPDVRLDSGVNDISARGQFANRQEVDRIEWHLTSALTRAYHIDAGTLIAAPSTTATFGSDNFFTAGNAKSVDKPRSWDTPAEVMPIAGTEDRLLLATYREGNFGYRLPLDDGEYEVTLHFMEPTESPGKRQFDVTANDKPLLERFDIASEAGKPLTAISRRFTVTVTDGQLELAFKPVQGDAVVSAFRVAPLQQ